MAGSPQHTTLVAATAATITLDGDYPSVEVVNVDGTAAIYFTVNNVTPVVEATGTHVLPAAIGAVEVVVPGNDPTTVVKAISAGTPKISVRGIR